MVNIKVKADDDGLLLEAWDRFYEIQIPLSSSDARELASILHGMADKYESDQR